MRPDPTDPAQTEPHRARFIAAALVVSLLAGAMYALLPQGDSPFDYTWRTAKAFLSGKITLPGPPPPWLNEMVPVPDGNGFTTVFPLGAVLTMLPFAAVLGGEFPARLFAGLIGAAITFFSCLIAGGLTKPAASTTRPFLLGVAMSLGTWTWANVAFGGAWQLAIGFATVGELGALYFLLVRFRPGLAGFFFALAFGNRTEILLLTPIFAGFIVQREHEAALPSLARFCGVPFLLGVATLAYNAARFGSPTQFGYPLIAGVLEEPWYREGIFALSPEYWARNAFHMLVEPWRTVDHAPWILPSPWGGSVFFFSPFLLLLLAPGQRPKTFLTAAWIAIFLLAAAVFSHGNPGGWQISYRYAIPMLPWALLLLASMERTYPRLETALVTLSVALNGYAAFVFLRTSWLTP